MIYEEVTMEKNFQVGEFLFEKAIIKGKLEPGETIAQALNAAKAEAIDWFNKNNPHLYSGYSYNASTPPVEIPVEKPIPEADMINGYIEAIQKCTTIPKPDGVDSFYNVAKQFPDVQKAYDIKKAELVKKETAEILAATEANCLNPKKL